MRSLLIRKVAFSYLDGLVFQDLSLAIEEGEMVGLLGPNGSGKTTLIKLAAGVLRPTGGKVQLDGTNLNKLSRREIAQRVAVVPQQFHMPFAFTVEEMVLLGRIPFIKTLTGETAEDRSAVHHAVQMLGIEHLKGRTFNELSGGERQKVILAMTLAQEPRLLLLDEPTQHLDIAHQVEILELIRGFNKERGLTVVGAMHDLNLAALYFDRLILLKDGSIYASGSPAEVLTAENIERVYSASVHVGKHPLADVPNLVVLPRNKQP